MKLKNFSYYRKRLDKTSFFLVIESLPILVLCYFLSLIHYYEVWLTIKVLVLLIVREKEVVIMGDRFGQ
jgi:hypothetical protein